VCIHLLTQKVGIHLVVSVANLCSRPVLSLNCT
jgi:hypothetical protein